ncbi:hypothetical protein SAMN05192574_11430 [Mucilaginibacter gossypiicola]|uniref:Uncharacterized protein n=1 Tax=Mucilaginibacter gossypiicola TaxID=551995 RepID=A0A1H8SZV9_9SPHI|nr:hypothetical protein SAMN05192574_11430 [Mucilaginibacter gossypiicola]
MTGLIRECQFFSVEIQITAPARLAVSIMSDQILCSKDANKGFAIVASSNLLIGILKKNSVNAKINAPTIGRAAGLSFEFKF